jgi:hypothetical protein
MWTGPLKDQRAVDPIPFRIAESRPDHLGIVAPPELDVIPLRAMMRGQPHQGHVGQLPVQMEQQDVHGGEYPARLTGAIARVAAIP